MYIARNREIHLKHRPSYMSESNDFELALVL